ncbi:MAG: CoA-binding protein [Bacteroidales bacterium]|nr:CoA-binding protein [Bacteroidales bacterium]
MKTLVVGASPNSVRYSYKAVRLLQRFNHEVVPLGIRKGEIDSLQIIKGKPELLNIHTITMYIGPAKQPGYYDYLLGLKPQRIIFNPGTENAEFINIAEKQGVETVQNCTLVMLNSNLY